MVLLSVGSDGKNEKSRKRTTCGISIVGKMTKAEVEKRKSRKRRMGFGERLAVESGGEEVESKNSSKRRRTVGSKELKVSDKGGKDAKRRNRKKKERLRRQGKNLPTRAGAAEPWDDAEIEGWVRKDEILSRTVKPCDGERKIEKKASGQVGSAKRSTFLEKMRARLSGGRFRMLNENLYTCKGDEAFELFQKDPEAFTLYHTGYQEQMSRWPVLPVAVVINWLKSRSPSLVVADFGCGDARLAKSVKNKVHSLDLVSSDPVVIACNMAHTPLETSSVDVAVFCLSLMGTDYPTFLQEAFRVLKPRGSLLIAEVKSRMDVENGGTDPHKFINALSFLGFDLVSQDDSNKMFIMFYLRKQEGSRGSGKSKIGWPELKPCVYKRR